VKRAALLTFLLAAAVGLVLAADTTWWLIAVGAFAILAAWGYTGGPKPYGYLGLGELFVFVFFGIVATVGTAYVASESVPGVTWVVASGVGFLACALLVMNNLRDIPTDTGSGKRTLAVRIGDRRTRLLYVALIVGALALAVVASVSRVWSSLAVASILVARAPIREVVRGATGTALIPVLEATGRTQLAYGILLSIGLALG
jgi:1,4-dihydroxy-2-naphthoate octaprenyltransferase